MNNTGLQGELIAKTYLLTLGYELISQNWRCRFGELDLIMRFQGVLVFLEVKTRLGNDVSLAVSSMTTRKMERLVYAVYAYLADSDLPDDNWRLDLVAVAIPRNGAPVITHMENCLDW